MLCNSFAPTPFFAPGNQAVIRSTTANAAMTNTYAATAPNAVITTFNGGAAAGQTAIPIFPRTLLFEGIKKKAQGMRGGILSWEQKLISVASDVDSELRRTKTGLTKYYHQQKALDPTKVARKNPAALLHNLQI